MPGCKTDLWAFAFCELFIEILSEMIFVCLDILRSWSHLAGGGTNLFSFKRFNFFLHLTNFSRLNFVLKWHLFFFFCLRLMSSCVNEFRGRLSFEACPFPVCRFSVVFGPRGFRGYKQITIFIKTFSVTSFLWNAWIWITLCISGHQLFCLWT